MQDKTGKVWQWVKKLQAKFTKPEKIVIGLLIVVILFSSAQLGSASGGEAIVPADGGVHIEGVVGTPRYINPLLAGTNQVDLDISRLVYSGLTRVTTTREVVPDLAVSWTVQDQGKSYVMNLREGVKWHDGQPFTADDVIYTINVLQNNDYVGVLKSNFSGVVAEKLDELVVRFTLPSPSSFFLYDLSTGIIPEHIFREIPVRELASNFKTSEIVGTGPFEYDNGVSNESVTLRKNRDYYGVMPHLDKIVFYFFDNDRTLQLALKNRTVSAAGLTEIPSTVSSLNVDKQYVYRMPQYRAVFFNQLGNNIPLKEKAVRQALAYAVNKDQIIQTVEGGNADRADSPILAGFWGHKPDIRTYNFDLALATKILNDAGWKDIDGDGIREKDNVRLSFNLVTRKDPKLSSIADKILENWKALGVEVNFQPVETANFIKDTVRTRNYDALLFGQDLGGNSDPYVYWHSTQIHDPGLALAPLVDKDIDNSLESARLASDANQIVAPYHRFQDAFAELVPAILLYTPRYTYIVDSKLKGVTENINLSSLSDRFANIDEWFIRTKKIKVVESQEATEGHPEP